jgi:hypothetical protein
MISNETLERIVAEIQRQPELRGAPILFYGNQQCRELFPGIQAFRSYESVLVIIEEASISESGVQAARRSTRDRAVESSDFPDAIRNESRVRAELIGAGLSCGAAALSGVGLVAGAAAEVPTGGAATILVVAAWAGLVTSSVQCVNGVARSYEAITNPDANTLQQWDQNTIYTYSINIVDGIGLAAGVASLGAGARNLFAILERRGALVTASELERMSRTQRQRAIENALRQATRTPEGQAAVREALEQAGFRGNQASRFAGAGARGVQGPSTIRQTTRVATVLSQESATRLNRTLVGVIGDSVGVVTNAMSSETVGSASGTLNNAGTLIIHAIRQDR